ncbi:MAG: methyltransferase domain-containing protein [Acidimicrobiales bacterium]
MTTNQDLLVDAEELRTAVRSKYSDVATNPDAEFHFQTGRPLAERLGYPSDILQALPDETIASFAGVDNPFAAGPIPEGSRVVDLGSGGGFDCLVASRIVGPEGRVVGVDMTPEMLERATRMAALVDATNVEYREGILEDVPVEDGWADVVISNGVVNLVADKAVVFAEAARILRPGGCLQIADIAVGAEVPDAARCDIDLWTDCIAGALSVDDWCDLITGAGFSDVAVGMPTDTFAGTNGEDRARQFQVDAHTFRARKPA